MFFKSSELSCRSLVALCAWVAPLAAQQAPACSGPGAAFGVTSYQCASCGFARDKGARGQRQFGAEPIVLETSSTSVLKPGDVIEAVGGEPIMTQAGADRFTYPPSGPTVINVRRGNARLQVKAEALGCSDSGSVPANSSQPLILVDGVPTRDLSKIDQGDIASIEVKKGGAAAGFNGPGVSNGVIVITTRHASADRSKAQRPREEPLYIIDGIPQQAVPNVDVNVSQNGRRFGFAVGCRPSCTRTKTLDGAEYYKFDGYPPIVALTAGGAAERAGLRVGDVVTQLDGKSILEEEGALRAVRGTKAETMRVTVLRNGAPVDFLLRAQ